MSEGDVCMWSNERSEMNAVAYIRGVGWWEVGVATSGDMTRFGTVLFRDMCTYWFEVILFRTKLANMISVFSVGLTLPKKSEECHAHLFSE